MVTTLRLAVLLTVVAVSLPAFPQPIDIDYRISLSQGGVPAVGVDVVYALVIEANWSTLEQEPFVARLTVPPELELAGVECHGGDPYGTIAYDAVTRTLTWSSRLEDIAFKSCPLIFRVAPGVTPGSPFALHATLTTGKPDPDPANDTATISAVVLSTSDLQVETTADAQRFRPGTTFRYTVSVTNRGPLDAHDVTLYDQLSPHVTFVSFEHVSGPAASVGAAPIGSTVEARIPVLPAGQTATFRLTVIANTASEAANIVNRAAAYAPSSFDPLEWNNESRLVTYAGPRADPAVYGSRGPETPERRTLVTLQVSNAGPDAVNNVTVSNSLRPGDPNPDSPYGAKFVSVTPSQGTCAAPQLKQLYIDHYPYFYWSVDCSLGALAPGAQATITAVVERGPLAGPIQYTASVGPAQNDLRPENNHVPVTEAPRRRSVRK